MRVCSVCHEPHPPEQYSPKASQCRECRRQRHKSNPRTLKNRHLRHNYGMTLDQFEQMLDDQDGRCAICGSRTGGVQLGKPKSLAVDHDHESGRVRGLLCDLCNRGLGLFRDDPQLLLEAALYLEEARLGGE